MLELSIALIIGLLAGTLTGLTPGIHINLVSTLLLSFLPSLTFISPISATTFIISMSITHTFVDFIPSIFLGAPEEDSFMAILPGHKMLKSGRGHEAVVLTCYGSILALPIIAIFTPLFIFFLPIVYNFLKDAIPYILIFVSLYMILREKKIISGFLIFLLSGGLGYASFNLSVKEPLLPLLTGLFGASSIILSLKNKSEIKNQKTPLLKEIKIKSKTLIRSFFSSFISAPLCSFLPGIGSGHAAVIASEIFKQSTKSFLIVVGALNTVVMGLSFVTLYSINKTRTGSAAAVGEILSKVNLNNLLLICTIITLTSIVAFFLTIKLSKIFCNLINKINYFYVNLTVIIILIIVNIVFTNWLGLLVLAIGTLIGIYTIKSENRRINMLGSIILPTIMYYLLN